ncbi:hypothetical protein Acr_14g0001640 [Actinidia rufa]|uniref:Uncharacterized protein n=1 Tax=Actinidia rufa TaxID=165716 RepID=A0A7J0FP93_9ERIC|nr:hypothetical protein Acr_14g0001640 [Actinidia rufa]
MLSEGPWALVSLCSDELVSAKGALNLSSQQLLENASRESIGRAYHATETFAQGLGFAKSQLRLTTEQVDIWLGCAELLQSLLGSGIATSLDDITDQESSGCLCDRYFMASSNKMQCDVKEEDQEEAPLSLCSDELVSAKGALNLFINLLSSQQLPENASRETIGCAYHTIEIFVRVALIYLFLIFCDFYYAPVTGLVFVKSQLRQIVKGSDLSNNSERGKDADDSSPDAALVWVIGRADPTSDKEADEGGCLHSSFGTLVDTSVLLSYSPYLGYNSAHVDLVDARSAAEALARLKHVESAHEKSNGMQIKKALIGHSFDGQGFSRIQASCFDCQHTNALKTLGENAGTRDEMQLEH